jgi:uncharacterized protein YkwD
MPRFLTAVTVLAAAALAAAAPAASPPSSVATAPAIAAQPAAAHDAASSPPGAADPGGGTRAVQLAAAEEAPQAAPQTAPTPPPVKSVDAARGPTAMDAGVTAVSPLSAPMGDTSNLVRDDNSAQVRAVFDAINAYRAQKGLNPVKYHLSVQDLAQEWSDSIASREVIEHRASFWTDPRAMNPNNGAGEVIAVRWDRDASQLVEWWKTSPSHNAILTDPRLNVIGIGITFTNGTYPATPNRYAMWGVVDFFGYTSFPSGTLDAPNGASTPAPAPSPSPSPTPTLSPGGVAVAQADKALCTPPARFMPTAQDMSKAALTSTADLVAVTSDGTLRAYPARSGGYGAPTDLGTGYANAITVNVTDWDRDGLLDLLVQWKDGRLTLLRGLAGGGFAAPVTLGSSGWETMTISLGEWCADNRLPQILAADGAGNLWLYPNRGLGDLVDRGRLATSMPAGQGNVVDFSGDGFEDLVVRRSDGALLLHRSLGQQGLVDEARATIGTGWSSMGPIRVLRGLDGLNTVGVASVRPDGALVYWPVAGGAFGASRVIGGGWAGIRLAQ